MQICVSVVAEPRQYQDRTVSPCEQHFTPSELHTVEGSTCEDGVDAASVGLLKNLRAG